MEGNFISTQCFLPKIVRYVLRAFQYSLRCIPAYKVCCERDPVYTGTYQYNCTIKENGYQTRQSSSLSVLFSCFGRDREHNSCLLHTEKLTNETCWLYNPCIVYERKTKDSAQTWSLNINLGTFLRL